jgi:hypothetical protein
VEEGWVMVGAGMEMEMVVVGMVRVVAGWVKAEVVQAKGAGVMGMVGVVMVKED